MNVKNARIAKNIEREISEIIFKEVKDLRNEMVSITGVKLARDLSYAKIYFTCLKEEKKEEIEKKLNHAKGFIRTELTKKVDIRHMPELNFQYDESIEYGEKIENIISDLHKN